ncbi:hypothetical protein Ctob_013386 [Chrysochromulina tobinii]|nr:hypothetical protein Ctob_013386 [Chrysochromulina tobinii]|eukprot:KOO53084.1 hypothetical protein Ctob_013386 [Chrysochromulina sp. CCMP291]
MRETKDRLHASEEKLRERDAEVARLRAELGRGARSEALEASLTAAVSRATAAAEAELRAVSDYVGETALEVAAASPARWQLGAWLEGLELTALLRDRLSVRRYLQRSSKRLALDPAPAKAEAQLCALEREFVRELGALASGSGALASGGGALASGGGALAHEGALSTARALVKSMLTEGGAGDDLLGLVAQRVAKYNVALRALGTARLAKLPADERRAVLGEYAAARFGRAAAELARAFEVTNRANAYPATLHTLAACLGKLGRIAEASTPLYRAPPAAGLPTPGAAQHSAAPSHPLVTPGTTPLPVSGGATAAPLTSSGSGGAALAGAVAGVEWGVLACTSSRQHAMSFASVVAGAQTVLQLEQSAVDRAADISWLSQYESRADAVFPPVCALDLRRTYLTSVESAQDGAGGGSSFPAMDAGEVLVIVLGVSTSWAKEAGRPWRREAAAYERRRDLAMGEMRGLSDGLAALAAKNAALERERNELRDKLSKQGEAPFPQGEAGAGDAMATASKAMATAEEAMALSERTLVHSESVSAGAAIVLHARDGAGARDGADARDGVHPADAEGSGRLAEEDEKRLERLQSENEALHEAVEAARHACACLRIGGLSAVPSVGAVTSADPAEPERSTVVGGGGARYGASLGRDGARDGARPRYDRPLEHARSREMPSADELGVAGAQPLPNTALPTPSPMPSLSHAPNTAQPHWTDEHTSPEAEAHARAVLGDAQGYAGCSPPQPTHPGLHPMYHGQHLMYPDSQQALSSPAVQTYYAQQAYKQQAYSQQALYPPPEPPPAEGGAQLGAPTELSRSREAREGGAPPLPSTPANSSLLKEYLIQRGQAAATQAASERWK